ncbi:hypothetical protein ACFX19_040963 [Malus domestica]
MTSYDKQSRRGCNSMKQWSREESTFSAVQKFGLEDEVEERMERGMTERGADKHRSRKKKGKGGQMERAPEHRLMYKDHNLVYQDLSLASSKSRE